MKRASGWLAALVVAGAIAAPSGAQHRINIPAARFEEPAEGETAHISINEGASERDHLRAMLLEWRQYTEEGNSGDANDVLAQMKELLATDGIKDEGILLGAFVAMGNDWAQTESWELSEKAYRAALELRPRHAPAQIALAEMAHERDGGFKGFMALMAGMVQAAGSGLSDPVGLVSALANFLYIAVIALAVTVGGISLVLMVKNNRLLRHGAMEWLSDRVPDGVDRVAGWALTFLPVMLFLSPPWWAVYWLVLFSGYATKGLKRLAVAALVVAILLPPAFHAVTVLSTYQQDPVLLAHGALVRRDVTQRNIEQVKSVAESTRAPEARFLLAQLQSTARRLDDAVASYTEVLSSASGKDARAIVNRGNIAFRRNDLASAIADYKLAVDTDRDLALAWRNGSIAHAQNLQADQAEEWISKAQQLDRGSVQEWKDVNGADRVVDADLTRGEVVGLLGRSNESSKLGLLQSFLNPLSIAAALGLVVLMIRKRRGMGPLDAAACEKCGRAFCTRCHAAAKSSAYCTQCVHLYVKKDGVSPVVRTAKLREVERHVTLTSIAVRLFNLLLPGAGSLYANRFLIGGLLLFTWAASLTALLLPQQLLIDSGRVGAPEVAVVFGVELVVLVLVYLVALMQSLKHTG